MTYSQKANPNATNSELDAKVIIKQPVLNSTQRDELIEQFVEIQVDSMDTKDLVHFVTETLKDDYGKLTDSELKDEIVYTNEQELYDELVDNVTQQYPKQLNTFGG